MSNIYIMCIYLYVWCVCVNTTCVFTLFNFNLKIIFDPEVFWSGVCVYTYIHTCICCESNWIRIYQWIYMCMGLPKWFSGKESAWQCKRYWRHEFDPWVGKISWRRMWQSTLIFLLDKSHGQRSMVDHSPWSHKELGMPELASSESDICANRCIYLNILIWLHVHVCTCEQIFMIQSINLFFCMYTQMIYEYIWFSHMMFSNIQSYDTIQS